MTSTLDPERRKSVEELAAHYVGAREREHLERQKPPRELRADPAQDIHNFIDGVVNRWVDRISKPK